jgi:RNA polymerase sigma-70 factor (ECF subfamily)
MAGGDEGAFNTLYERYWAKLFAIAYNRLQSREAAEDVVHDVFASFWANRSSSDIQSVENYLAVAVKYAVLLRLRRQRRERDYSLSGLSYARAEFPESRIDDRQLLVLIQREVEKLPERCRLVFKCSREQGMPVREIARTLQLSPKTVENQLTRALRHLRLALRSLLHSGLWILASFFC